MELADDDGARVKIAAAAQEAREAAEQEGSEERTLRFLWPLNIEAAARGAFLHAEEGFLETL